LLGLLAEAEPGFFSAFVSGAKCSGFNLEGAAYRREDKIFQTYWKPHLHMQPPAEEQVSKVVKNSLIAYLNSHNEPIDYFGLFNQALFTYERMNETIKNSNSQPGKYQKQFLDLFTEILSDIKIWKRFKFQEKNPESGYWWLKNPEPVSHLTLSDRIELAVLDFLNKHTRCRFIELDNYLCSIFKGFYTPSRDLIQNCLISYASQSNESSSIWSLNDNEKSNARLKDIEQIKISLVEIGKKLGFIPKPGQRLFWENNQGEPIYEFVILSTAVIGPFCLDTSFWKAKNKFIILPGSRSQLLHFKKEHDPRLEELFNQEFHFLKFRHIQNMMGRTHLNLTEWNELIELDPPDFIEPKQISMF
jgi:hypothetical protein